MARASARVEGLSDGSTTMQALPSRSSVMAGTESTEAKGVQGSRSESDSRGPTAQYPLRQLALEGVGER